jgi:hypothetical protein
MTITRKTIIGGALGVAVGAAVIATPMLTASASAGPGRDFTVHARNSSDMTIDNGAKGFSTGDVDVSSASLTRAGKRVGWLAGTCTTTRVGKSSADQFCQFVLHLGRSQLVAEGATRSGQQGPGTFALAITGGTGRYQQARGQVLVTATNGRSLPLRVELRG